MNWKCEIVKELKKHGLRRQALSSIKQRIDILEADYSRLQAVQTDREAARGGGSRAEERLVNNIVERDRLLDQYQITQAYIRWMENALRKLSHDERMVLEYFYIDRPEDYMDQLCERLGCEQAQIYRIKERALKQLMMRLYAAA